MKVSMDENYNYTIFKLGLFEREVWNNKLALFLMILNFDFMILKRGFFSDHHLEMTIEHRIVNHKRGLFKPTYQMKVKFNGLGREHNMIPINLDERDALTIINNRIFKHNLKIGHMGNITYHYFFKAEMSNV